MESDRDGHTSSAPPAELRPAGSLQTDEGIVESLPWLTPRRIILFVIAWIVAFALGSLAISNPFASEPSAGATPNFWHVMYLHGLLIAMVGLIALVALDVFGTCCSKHVRVWIALGVVGATVLTAMGGIWDTRVPGAEAAMWTQIAGFFMLDEILILLVYGFYQGWRARTPQSRTLPFLAGWMAAASMFIAAIMGHIAGWMLEYNNHPGVIFQSWANWAGEPWQTLRDNMVGSHSHEMAVASMALVLSAALIKFGYQDAKGALRWVSRVGVVMVICGIFSMTGVYAAMAVTSWVVPNYPSHGQGIAGDDLLTGIFVMLGGLIALWPVLGHLVARLHAKLTGTPLPVAVGWAWTSIVFAVVTAGFYIEMNENFFGAGAKAAGATNDAVFTWLHQDVGLFIFPGLVAMLLLADRLAGNGYRSVIGWSSVLGVSMLLIGGGIWVFMDPRLHGPGYVVSTVGLALVGASIGLMLISGLLGDGRLRLGLSHRGHAPVMLLHHHGGA